MLFRDEVKHFSRSTQSHGDFYYLLLAQS